MNIFNLKAKIEELVEQLQANGLFNGTEAEMLEANMITDFADFMVDTISDAGIVKLALKGQLTPRLLGEMLMVAINDFSSKYDISGYDADNKFSIDMTKSKDLVEELESFIEEGGDVVQLEGFKAQIVMLNAIINVADEPVTMATLFNEYLSQVRDYVYKFQTAMTGMSDETIADLFGAMSSENEIKSFSEVLNENETNYVRPADGARSEHAIIIEDDVEAFTTDGRETIGTKVTSTFSSFTVTYDSNENHEYVVKSYMKSFANNCVTPVVIIK